MSTETTASLVAEMRERAFVHGESAIAAEIVRWAKRLEALEARFVVVGYASATNLADYRANHRGTFAVWKDADDHDDVPVYAAAQRQEQEGNSHG